MKDPGSLWETGFFIFIIRMKNIIMKALGVIFLAFLFSNCKVYAVSAYPYKVSVLIADGKLVDIYMKGDEHLKYAKTHDILIGLGRGSAAGSLVSYCLGITNIDPIKYNLLFERFLNPERKTMPDIDTDFPDDKRDTVIDYVREKYGDKRVSGIITFGTLAAKQAIRDVSRVLNIPIYKVDYFLIFVLEKYTLLIKPLSFGPYFPNLSDALILIYYVLYFFFLYYASHDFVPLTRAFLIAQVSTLILLAVPLENQITNEVNFINVGQGDCTLVRDHNKVSLIDTGGLTYTDIANDVLVPYLKKKRIYKIDMVIITHYDYDHYGALEELQKTYKVNQVYDYSSSFPVSLGNITFNNYNYYGQGRKEENDKSLVIGFNVCNKDFLIMGDAPTYVEKQIMQNESNIPCDILRVGHHGSTTSTSADWIKFTTPEEAVISVGKNNKFGHPNKEVISVLKKYKINIRRTDLEGTIVYRQFA